MTYLTDIFSPLLFGDQFSRGAIRQPEGLDAISDPADPGYICNYNLGPGAQTVNVTVGDKVGFGVDNGVIYAPGPAAMYRMWITPQSFLLRLMALSSREGSLKLYSRYMGWLRSCLVQDCRMGCSISIW